VNQSEIGAEVIGNRRSASGLSVVVCKSHCVKYEPLGTTGIGRHDNAVVDTEVFPDVAQDRGLSVKVVH